MKELHVLINLTDKDSSHLPFFKMKECYLCAYLIVLETIQFSVWNSIRNEFRLPLIADNIVLCRNV